MQIAPYLGGHTKCAFPSIRLAQQTVGDTTPGVATIVIQDLGDPLSPPPAGSMHPRDKFAVGARLASAALALGFIGDPPPPPAANASWGGPSFASITRDGPSAFTVHLGTAAGLKTAGSRGCADVEVFDDGTNRTKSERCCDAPDTFQLWPNVNATQQAAPWTPTSGPTAAVNCTVVGTALKCTTLTPITGTPVWTFAWQAFPMCMLVNDAQLPASPMRAVVPARVGLHGAGI